MKARLNFSGQHTDGQIAAAQGAAAAMPESEVLTLNTMFKELETLKPWTATAATNAEVAHRERRINFIDIQLSGTNDRLNAHVTQTDGAQGAM